MMKRMVRFSVVLFSAASFALAADNSNNNKNSSKSSSTPADLNVFHALQRLFKGKDGTASRSPASIRHRKTMRRVAEEANPASSPESKATPEATPSSTPRRVVLPESSAKPTASATAVSSPNSGASPTQIVVPLPSPGKGDETPKGN
jgi:hypothetical protein